MKAEKFSISIVAAALCGLAGAVSAETMGTAFTYQGQLKRGGVPVNAACDLAFSLWDAVAGPAQVGSTLSLDSVSVTNGLFTAKLDFGNAFDGDARWLEIAVCCPPGDCGGPWDLTTLDPRQELTPAPLALALPGLYTQQNAGSPNLIGGHSGNGVTPGTVGATIGGGGKSAPFTNRVTDDYGTIGGGRINQAGDDAGVTTDATYATVGGGDSNTASGHSATVGGGGTNIASSGWSTVAGGGLNAASGESSTVGGGWWNDASEQYATVGGGVSNNASGAATVGGGESNTASGQNATVGGGESNTASRPHDTVGGGESNTASGMHATVGGGWWNTADGSLFSTVSGGGWNTASGSGSTVGGGTNNTASGDLGSSTVGGGQGNTASARYSTVGGGWLNTASDQYATVGGGGGNTASGSCSVCPGGCNCSALGAGSFAAGTGANALHDGSFVWADTSSDQLFSSKSENEFCIRATGGTELVSAVDLDGNPSASVTLAPGGSAWSTLSSRTSKANFAAVSGRDILERLAGIPIETWNYKAQNESIRHIGPMAGDFHTAFGVGENEKLISTIDADGVALAAVKGLYEIVKQKEADITALQARLTALEKSVGKTGPSARASSLGMATPALAALCLVGFLAMARGRKGGAR